MKNLILKVSMILLMLAMVLPSAAQHRPTSSSYNSRPTNNGFDRRPERSGFFASPITTPGEIYYTLKLGMNVATITGKDFDADGSRVGLNVGAGIGVPLSNQFPLYLESGLYYSEKGAKESDYSCSQNYLEVPVIVRYAIPVADRFAIEPFAGGYLSYGIGGEIKNKMERAKWDTFSDDFFRRFDAGIKIGATASFEMINVELGYDFGIYNNNQNDFESSHTGAFFATLGVRF